MSKTFQMVLELITKSEIKISDHGYDELAEDDILIKDIVAGAKEGIVVEDYPGYPKGPCTLVLQYDHAGNPIHVVWGIPKNAISPAIVVTAYRPDADQWTSDFKRRKP